MFVPMMIGSNTDELNAMASRILGHRIKRLLRKSEQVEVDELVKVRGFRVLLPDWAVGIVILSLIFILPYVFVVVPTIQTLSDDATLRVMGMIALIALSMITACQLTVFTFSAPGRH